MSTALFGNTLKYCTILGKISVYATRNATRHPAGLDFTRLFGGFESHRLRLKPLIFQGFFLYYRKFLRISYNTKSPAGRDAHAAQRKRLLKAAAWFYYCIRNIAELAAGRENREKRKYRSQNQAACRPGAGCGILSGNSSKREAVSHLSFIYFPGCRAGRCLSALSLRYPQSGVRVHPLPFLYLY